MFDVGARKLLLKCFTLIVLLSGLFFFSRESTQLLLASSQASQGRTQLPTISITLQDEVPLRIVNSFAESSGPEDFRIRVIVQNQSDKLIRSFAITANNTVSGVHSTRLEFVNLTKSTSILQPTQTTEVSFAYRPNDLPEIVKLGVDFVEFGDGTTAGPDTRNSRDRLAGMREGAKREKQRLRDLLKRKGPSNVLDSVKIDPASETEPDGTSKTSEEWREGFRSGVGAIRQRIKRTGQANDLKQIQLELSKSFDAAEEPQQ